MVPELAMLAAIFVHDDPPFAEYATVMGFAAKLPSVAVHVMALVTPPLNNCPPVIEVRVTTGGEESIVKLLDVAVDLLPKVSVDVIRTLTELELILGAVQEYEPVFITDAESVDQEVPPFVLYSSHIGTAARFVSAVVQVMLTVAPPA